MKNYLTGLLLILVIVSCTKKKENEVPVLDNKVVSMPVGVINNGAYHIIELDKNGPKWEAGLRNSFRLGNNVSFSKFEIVKTKTLGDVSEDCYLLITRVSGGLSTIGVILDLKDDKFYFDVNTNGKKSAGWAIMCESSNAALGCLPAVVVHNNQKSLVCSSNDCAKVVSEIPL